MTQLNFLTKTSSAAHPISTHSSGSSSSSSAVLLAAIRKTQLAFLSTWSVPLRSVLGSLSASSPDMGVVGTQCRKLFSWLARSLRTRMFVLTLIVLAVALKFVRGRVDPHGKSDAKKLKGSTQKPAAVGWVDDAGNVSDAGGNASSIALGSDAPHQREHQQQDIVILAPAVEEEKGGTTAVKSAVDGVVLRRRSKVAVADHVVAPVGSSNDIRTPVLAADKLRATSGDGKGSVAPAPAPASWEVVEDVLDSDDDDDDGGLFF